MASCQRRPDCLPTDPWRIVWVSPSAPSPAPTARAERRGLLAARVGHGTWVKGANTDPANEWVIRQEEGHRIELWQNLPVQLDRAAIIRPMLGEVADGDLNALLGYDKEAGRPDQRQQFVDWLAEQGVACSEDRLLFSHGAQHGIMLAPAGDRLRGGDHPVRGAELPRYAGQCPPAEESGDGARDG